VLKCYLMSSICELYQHQIYREVRLHSSCNHENIINLFAAFQVRWPLDTACCTGGPYTYDSSCKEGRMT